jgi:hypothetical protein
MQPDQLNRRVVAAEEAVEATEGVVEVVVEVVVAAAVSDHPA